MKVKALILSSVMLSGCASSNIDKYSSNDTETIPCVAAQEVQVKISHGYRLVFFARNFTSSVQVWLNPMTAKTIVLRAKPMSSELCYVFEGFPATTYSANEMSQEAINTLPELKMISN